MESECQYSNNKIGDNGVDIYREIENLSSGAL